MLDSTIFHSSLEVINDNVEEISEVCWSPGYPEVPADTDVPSFLTSLLVTETETDLVENKTLLNFPFSAIQSTEFKRSFKMSLQLEQVMSDLASISGFIAAAVVNAESGMSLAQHSVDASFNVEIAAAANTEVVRAKHQAMMSLGLNDAKIDDILISLTSQYHLIRPSGKNPLLFIYLAVDRKRANLALARHTLTSAEAKLDI